MSKIIKRHYKKVTSKPRDQRPKCNCRKNAECLLEDSNQVNDVVYKYDVKRPFPIKVYLRFAEGEWKSRFYTHKLSFKHNRYSNKSETPNLKWSVLRCVPPYTNDSKKHLLCLYEKLEIGTYQNQKEPLNKRSELLCKCRHANKFL